MSTIKFGFTAKHMIDEGRVTEKGISFLKTWLSTQKFPKLTDEQIVIFLMSCQNDQDSTKATIKAHYAVKNRSPRLFDNRKVDREDLLKQMATVALSVMPERTDDGDVVIYTELFDTNYLNLNMELYMMHLFMTLDYLVYDDPPKGLILLYNMKGMGLMHLTRLRFGLMRAYFQYLQEGLPLRLKSAHMFNSVYFLDKVMNLLTPFMKKEVIDLTHFHQPNMDMELFYKKWIPKRCLPEDLGGDLPSVRDLHDENIKNLKKMQAFFDAEERQRYNIN